MTDPEPRLQPGVTPEHHALLVEAAEAAKAFPGGPERLALVIAAALAASRPRAPEQIAERHAGACCEEPEPDPDLEAEAEAEWADEWDGADSAAYQARVEVGLEPEAGP